MELPEERRGELEELAAHVREMTDRLLEQGFSREESIFLASEFEKAYTQTIFFLKLKEEEGDDPPPWTDSLNGDW